MQRQGQDPDGETAPTRTATPARKPAKREPFRIGQFLREVRSELRQVAWPNRASLMVLIFILNYAFAKGVLWLFKP